ncbi:MAG: hypothetical protein ACM3KM_03250 [Acidobacteriaceae bacterium]
MKLKVFLVLVVVFVTTYLFNGRYRGVKEISPAVLSDPQQVELADLSPIQFSKDGWNYSLTPVYQYSISGLIVSRMDYRWFSLNRTDETFPVDLCMTWGENAATKAFAKTSFRQDNRWCYWTMPGNLKVNQDEVSNNHLIVNNPSLEKRILSLKTGDQVKIKGKLVNVKAATDEPGRHESSAIAMNSSTVREDSGAGACEIIYVEDVEVLKLGHPLSAALHELSIYGLIMWLGWIVCSLGYSLYATSKRTIRQDFREGERQQLK